MPTIIKGELLATLKGAELLARQIVERNPQLFPELLDARPVLPDHLRDLDARVRGDVAAHRETAAYATAQAAQRAAAPPPPGARADATNTEAA